MAVLVSAGILGQWPIGRLADKFGRLLVLRVQVFVVILGSIAMLSRRRWPQRYSSSVPLALRYIRWRWRACEKVEHHQLVAMNQGLTVELYRGKPAWPVIYRYANAEFLR